MPSLEDKKKSKASPSEVATGATTREGTQANPTTILGPKASMLKNPTMEKLDPPIDKKEVEKLYLDWAILKFFHIVGQLVI